MNIDDATTDLKSLLEETSLRLSDLAAKLDSIYHAPQADAGSIPTLYLVIILVLACFVGYYVVWSVTSALHSPLMGVTNAISSVIVVGALIAVGGGAFSVSSGFGLAAVFLTGINIFGGFIITRRMLNMFIKPKKRNK